MKKAGKNIIATSITIPRQTAIERISEQIDRGYALLDRLIPDYIAEGKMEYARWDRSNLDMLQKMFVSGEKAGEYQCCSGPTAISGCWQAPPPVIQTVKLRTWLKEKINCLKSIQGRLDRAVDRDGEGLPAAPRKAKERKVSIIREPAGATRQKDPTGLSESDLRQINLLGMTDRSRIIMLSPDGLGERLQH